MCTNNNSTNTHIISRLPPPTHTHHHPGLHSPPQPMPRGARTGPCMPSSTCQAGSKSAHHDDEQSGSHTGGDFSTDWGVSATTQGTPNMHHPTTTPLPHTPLATTRITQPQPTPHTHHVVPLPPTLPQYAQLAHLSTLLGQLSPYDDDTAEVPIVVAEGGLEVLMVAYRSNDPGCMVEAGQAMALLAARSGKVLEMIYDARMCGCRGGVGDDV